MKVRRWRMKCLLFCAGMTVFTTLWIFLTLVVIVAQEQQRDYYERQNALEQFTTADDYMGRGIQVVVGHFNGRLPGEKKEINLTQEILNANDFNPRSDAGAHGHAVRLSAEDELRSKDLFQVNQFNLVASDQIPLNRSLPDVRKQACRDKIYPASLPTASVIIVFHNEAWSTLLRTVTSVIDRSPRAMLKEIILVDDDSEREFLKEPLERFVATLPVPVKVLRAAQRAGLIRARLLGAAEAKGDVLTFLDSHCECTQGWLEPMLARIAEKRTAVVCPVIDVLNDQTFAYQRGIELFRGGFNWNLQFRWYSVPTAELKLRGKDPTAPIRSPTMAGGLFSIERRYFEELGTYDKNMDIWGGENLEMSFRVWQCGGSVEILPCSHVGHVFRKASPHDFPDKGSGTILNSNLVRVAEVWMDEWKHIFYKTAPQAEDLSRSINVDDRRALRQQLKCKPFSWYLDKVWPQHFLPKGDGVKFGRIRNVDEKLCLEMAFVSSQTGGTEKRPSLGECDFLAKFARLQIRWSTTNQCLVSLPSEPSKRQHSLTISQCTLGFDMWQMWIYSPEGQIKSDEHQCLQAVEIAQSWIVQLKECLEAEREFWDYSSFKQQFVHRESGLCLDAPVRQSAPDETKPPSLRKCSRDLPSQRWSLLSVKWKPDPV